MCQWQVLCYKDEVLSQTFQQWLFGWVRSAALLQQAKQPPCEEEMKTWPCGQEGWDGTKGWRLRAGLPAPPLASISIEYFRAYRNHKNAHMLFIYVILFLERVKVSKHIKYPRRSLVGTLSLRWNGLPHPPVLCCHYWLIMIVQSLLWFSWSPSSELLRHVNCTFHLWRT